MSVEISSWSLMARARSFLRQNLTNSAANLVYSVIELYRYCFLPIIQILSGTYDSNSR